MNAAATIAVSILASASVAFVVTEMRQPEPQTGVPETAGGAPADALAAEVDRLRGVVESLQSQRVTAGPGRTEVESASIEERIRAAVDAEITRRAAEPGGLATAVDAAATSDFDMAKTFEELLASGSVNPHVNTQIWKRITEAGKVDEAVEMFRARAERLAQDADAQADYGEALGAKIMQSDNVMEQGQNAMIADAAYDKALELDSKHWRARFNKAVSYSFWPSMTGKPAEAVDHLVTLMGQQEAAPSPGHGGYSQTYLILGNLYAQQGKSDLAKETWQRGLRLHPNDTGLQAKARGN